uniref:Uncharacterized protein n=1 Tax=Meloidogyne enterolobii TaxID=390850 RepID=A0A6V7YAQ3_MELEN|nr:unnamed protein product [Meloidogyne enterolobii]
MRGKPQIEEKLKKWTRNPYSFVLHHQNSSKNIVICLIEGGRLLLLQLPDIIKSKGDIRIVY